MKINLSKNFNKSLNRLDSELQKKVLLKLRIFKEDWKHPSLKTHKLKGELDEIWSFRITYSVRVLFYFEKEDIILVLDIGQHNDIY